MMSLPSTQELKGVIVDILSRARDDGQLSQLTVRIVRRELATHFDLEEDVLNSGKYKSFIKSTVHATVDDLQNAHAPVDGAGLAPKKAKEDDVAKTDARKRKSKVQVQPSDKEHPEDGSLSNDGAPPSKKTSVRSQTSKAVKPSKTSKKPESETKYKSKAIIESSDEEVTPESGTRKPARSPKKEKTLSPPKQKQQHVNENNSNVEMDINKASAPPTPTSKRRLTTQSPKKSVSKMKELARDPMESELSSVVDEPPKKRQKKQEKESVKPRKDGKTKQGKKKEVLSKDEETVNKLKSIVVACGVRKVWKKEFEGLDKPSQQIKRLHSILGDLGMTPRYSLEKAKALREQRELAQELKDVQEFEKKTKRREKGFRTSPEANESSDQGESDAGVPAQKKRNARASITAFLQDQSDEE